jgi:type IV secretory pathway VirB2 component (pilin)
MMLLPQTRDLAQRLLTYESAAGKTSEPSEFPAYRVCETLRQPLCAIAGVAGFRSLLSRALTLARADAPSLGAVQVAADGSLQGLDELLPQIDKDQARQAGVILIAQLIGLLLFFIGEGMTLRLVISEVLPHIKFLSNSGLPIGFEAILNEVDQLQGVSTRLDGLAEQNPPLKQALTTIAENVRNTATVLAVVAVVKSPKPN